MQRAKSLLATNQGQAIMNVLKDKGFDLNKISSAEVKSIKGKKAVVVTASRQIKIKEVPAGDQKKVIDNLINCKEPIQISCSRLARGPYDGKTFKVWHDPKVTAKNRLASKILGFPVSGAILIVMEEGDIIRKSFFKWWKTRMRQTFCYLVP